MPTWAWVLLIVLLVLALFGGFGVLAASSDGERSWARSLVRPRLSERVSGASARCGVSGRRSKASTRHAETTSRRPVRSSTHTTYASAGSNGTIA